MNGDRAETWLRRFGPLAAAVVSIVVVWFVWGAIVPIAKVHDENSYLLQAQIFASGRWTAPSPPIPEFFEQPHVLVVPRLASKYPPGHALLLSLGALVGFPPLVPLLLTGISAALTFGLAMRSFNPWVGLLTWLIWITAPIVLRFQPSYFSELTTSVMVLGSWWLLLEWRETRRRRWLLLLALAVGWGAITRPLTMLAVAVPIGVVVLRDVIRMRLWRDFGLAFGVGLLTLGILPLWNARTTGDWRLSPVELYRRDYLPFDKVGFTPDTTPPRRHISPALDFAYFESARTQQTLGALPRTTWERLTNVFGEWFGGSRATGYRGDVLRLALLAFAVAGLFSMNGTLAFGLTSAAVLFVAHLPYAHWASWTVYYLEMTPVMACLGALGMWRAAQRFTATDGARQRALSIASIVIALLAVPSILWWREDHDRRSRFDRVFIDKLRQLPQHSMVFIRYSPRVKAHMAVVWNYPDLSRVPVWVVHDLGARNAELRRIAPDRVSFDFEEDQLVGQNR